MKDSMNLNEAVHILREEAVRCRRMAGDMAKDPLDQDGKCIERAKKYRKRAEAIDMVVGALMEKTDPGY